MMKQRLYTLFAFLSDGSILLLLGGVIVCSVLVFFLLPWRTLELSRSGVSTQGMVVGRSSCDAGSEGSYQAGWVQRITYTDLEGRSHTFLTFCSSWKPAVIGSHIAVRYLPSQPATADLEENIASGVGSSIAMLAIGLLLLVGVMVGGYHRVANHFSL